MYGQWLQSLTAARKRRQPEKGEGRKATQGGRVESIEYLSPRKHFKPHFPAIFCIRIYFLLHPGLHAYTSLLVLAFSSLVQYRQKVHVHALLCIPLGGIVSSGVQDVPVRTCIAYLLSNSPAAMENCGVALQA